MSNKRFLSWAEASREEWGNPEYDGRNNPFTDIKIALGLLQRFVSAVERIADSVENSDPVKQEAKRKHKEQDQSWREWGRIERRLASRIASIRKEARKLCREKGLEAKVVNDFLYCMERSINSAFCDCIPEYASIWDRPPTNDEKTAADKFLNELSFDSVHWSDDRLTPLKARRCRQAMQELGMDIPESMKEQAAQ